ncbi:MAG: phage tail protein [Roseovarius sp.]
MSDTSQIMWPLSPFRFEVDLAGQTAVFQEVSGINVEAQVIEYRAETSKPFSAAALPSRTQSNVATLKHGSMAHGHAFWDWYTQAQMNSITPQTVTIRLLDEDDHTVMRWVLSQAWPTSVSTAGMTSHGTGVAIESIELAHTGLTIDNDT